MQSFRMQSLIGRSGVLGPLRDGGNNLSAMKDDTLAIFNLCIFHENKTKAVKDRVVRVLLSRIKSGVCLDELLTILAMLSTHQRAIEELGQLGAVPSLIRIIRESSSAQNKENCIAILYVICLNDKAELREVKEEESCYGTLSQLARDETSRAKRKANRTLERLNRAMNRTHSA